MESSGSSLLTAGGVVSPVSNCQITSQIAGSALCFCFKSSSDMLEMTGNPSHCSKLSGIALADIARDVTKGMGSFSLVFTGGQIRCFSQTALTTLWEIWVKSSDSGRWWCTNWRIRSSFWETRSLTGPEWGRRERPSASRLFKGGEGRQPVVTCCI